MHVNVTNGAFLEYLYLQLIIKKVIVCLFNIRSFCTETIKKYILIPRKKFKQENSRKHNNIN